MKRFATRNRVLGLVVLVGLAFAESARADTWTTVNIGNLQQGNYDAVVKDFADPSGSHFVGSAGSFTAATLGGHSETFMYCLSITNPNGGIAQNTQYTAEINSIGVLPGFNRDNNIGPHNGLDTNQIYEIAYIVKHWGALTAPTGPSTFTKAVQEAIWQVEYNGAGTTSLQTKADFAFPVNNSSPGAYDRLTMQLRGPDAGAQFADASIILADAAGHQTAPTSDLSGVVFINPVDLSQGHNGVAPASPNFDVQGLITYDPTHFSTVPVPGTLVMSCILFGMAGVVWSFKRVNQRNAAA